MKKENTSGKAINKKEEELDFGTRDAIVNHLIKEMNATAKLIVNVDLPLLVTLPFFEPM